MTKRESTGLAANSTSSPPPQGKFVEAARFSPKVDRDSSVPVTAPGRHLVLTGRAAELPRSIEVKVDLPLEARIAAAARLTARLKDR